MNDATHDPAFRIGAGATPVFDRDFSLEELLRGVNRAKLQAALCGLLGDAVALSDRSGNLVLGAIPQASAKAFEATKTSVIAPPLPTGGGQGEGESNKAAAANSDHPNPSVHAGQSLSGTLRAAEPCKPAILPVCPPQGEGAGMEPVSTAEATSPRCRLPLKGQLEPVGYLEAEGAANARPVADLLEILLFVSAKYLMASDLHLQAVEEDYAELQRKHEALQESEIRYRQLAENLEQRVDEQVKTLETAQRQIFASEKLASVGRLAAGVAHEINTPLGFIKSNLSTALTYLEDLGRYGETLKSDPAAARELWQKTDLDFVIGDFTALARESLDGVNRAAKIVADLRGFARIDEGGEHKADVNAIIRQVCDVAAARVQERIHVVLDLPQVPWVRCDPARLGQVIYNLLVNAIDAIPAEGEIAFSTAVDGEKVLIRARDTGGGIPEEVAPYIFDLFFTTKDVGQGMGMGLSFCHDVIRGYGGAIAVESRMGEGSTFTVTLPAADAAS